jgi:hypothetical protein
MTTFEVLKTSLSDATSSFFSARSTTALSGWRFLNALRVNRRLHQPFRPPSGLKPGPDGAL